MFKTIAILTIMFFFANVFFPTGYVFAQDKTGDKTTAKKAAYRIPETSLPIKVDGVIDEKALGKCPEIETQIRNRTG